MSQRLQMPQVPSTAVRVKVEYPDGNQYIITRNRLEGCWNSALATRNGLIAKGVAEEVANLAIFKVVEYS